MEDNVIDIAESMENVELSNNEVAADVATANSGSALVAGIVGGLIGSALYSVARKLVEFGIKKARNAAAKKPESKEEQKPEGTSNNDEDSGK